MSAALFVLMAGCPGKSDDSQGQAGGSAAVDGGSGSNAGSATGGQQTAGGAVKQTVQDDPEFRRAFNQAMGMMGQFKYAEAYAAFAKLLQQHPLDTDLAVNTAIARLNMAGDEDLMAAKGIIEQVLKLDPKHLRGNYCLGLIKSYMGPPADPLPHFQICRELDKSDADVAYLNGKSLEQAQQLDDAKQEFLRCLQLNEYYASAMLGLSRIAGAQKDTDGAKDWIRQFEAMKSNPNARVFEFAYKRMGRLGEVMGGEDLSQPVSAITDDMWFLPSAKIFEADKMPESFRQSLAADGSSANVALADLNGDGHLDVTINVVGAPEESANVVTLWNDGAQQFALGADLPWNQATAVNAVLVGDVDQDGRNDVYLCRRGTNQLYLQKEPGAWELSPDAAVGGGDWDTTSGLLIDADHDGDLDLVLANRNGPAQVINNNRNGTFRILADGAGFAADSENLVQVVAGDFDNQRDLDLWVRRGDGKPSQLLLNQKLWRYETDPSLASELATAEALGAVAMDINHDGHVDLLVWKPGTIEVWHRRLGQWEKSASFEVTMDNHPALSGQFAALDLNADGRPELVFPTLSGFAITEIGSNTDIDAPLGHGLAGWAPAALTPTRGWSLLTVDRQGSLWNLAAGPPEGSFVAVEFSGKQNDAEEMRSNRSGIGTRWKARIGQRWVTGAMLPQSSLASQSLQPQPIGLVGAESIDFLAVDWSDGVFQAELGLTASGVKRITETQRQLASCPLIFAWDGQQISFVTDTLGVGGIGFMTGPGEYAPPRPWENLLLSSQQLQPQGDRYVIKLAEPMEEACYLREATLSAIDLPAGWQAIIDERMGITDPQPTGAIHYFRHSEQVIAARILGESLQADVLHSADRRAVDPGLIDHRFIGMLQSESQLEFGFENAVDAQRGQPALAISGWVEYPYSQTVFAAWQAGRKYEAPTLEVSDDGVQWRACWSELGYPAGMPRSMMVPLPESARGARWFRLRTNMQVYWDQIQLVYLEPCPEARVTKLPLARADLRSVGYARRTTGPQYLPQYDYQQRRGTWDCRHLPGYYTRFGDVLPLLTQADHPLAVFGPGEEIHLEFSAAPPIASGQQRWFQLGFVGWCKDMDLYTDTGDQLGPMPDSGAEGDKTKQQKQLYELYNYRYESGPWLNHEILPPEK